MHYWLQKEADGLRIDFEVAESEQAALLDSIHTCLAGNSGCDIHINDRLHSMKVEQYENELQLSLKNISGREFDQAVIHQFLKCSIA
ncbi:MAG: hypothetical protein ABW162_06390 [Candidatus Sedimenticola sp. PURPLELP]